MLNYESRDIDDVTLEETLSRYSLFIHKVIEQNQFDILNGVLCLYAHLLISCNNINIANNYVVIFFTSFFDQHKISEINIVEYRTDMAIALAEREKFISIVMPWIIEYFSRSKSASIDLNRYKLEAFLMTTKCLQANKAIKDAIFSKDCHIREHMSDIVGEKELIDAKVNLIHQLEIEENFYTAVSIIEAIGKIGTLDDILIINKWLNKFGAEIIHDKMFSVLRHAQVALIKLDKTFDKKYIKEFNDMYGKYLSEFVPL